MAPVAEVTYFDSGTIEYPTYRVVAAKEYSDGSAGGGGSPRVCGNTPREVAGSDIKPLSRPPADGVITILGEPRRRERPVARTTARTSNPLGPPSPPTSFLLPYIPRRLRNFQRRLRDAPKSEEKKCRADRDPESDRSPGKLACAEVEDRNFSRPCDGRSRGGSKRRREEESRGKRILSSSSTPPLSLLL